MNPLPLLRPRARAYGIAITAGALGYASTQGGGAVPAWAAVGLGAVVVSTAILAILGFLRDLRRPVTRTLVPAQLQVGQPSVSTLEGRPDRWGPASRIVSHLSPSVHREMSGYSERLLPQARGLVQLGPAIRHRGDALDMFTWRTPALGPVQELVWPRTNAIPASALQVLLEQMETHRGTPSPSVDDLTLRGYQPGDPLSRIDWKRSATHGSILVRKAEPRSDLRMDLALTPGSEPATDRGVDILASLAYALAPRGFNLRLLNGDTCIEGELPQLLDALALAQTAPSLPQETPRGQVVLALGDPAPAAVLRALSWLAQGGVEPTSTVFFPTLPLPAESRRLLQGSRVVET